jgi:hypothetical protein
MVVLLSLVVGAVIAGHRARRSRSAVIRLSRRQVRTLPEIRAVVGPKVASLDNARPDHALHCRS